MEEENKGLTLKSIFSTIWLRKWVALIVGVLVALICAVSLFYGYNARAQYYVMEFSLNLPGGDNGVAYTYPNGTQLYYADMTSAKTLKSIKDANEAFNDIDVDSMAAHDRINITRNINITTDDANESVNREITYTITAQASCFSGAWQARQFLAEIASEPAKYLENMKINYGVYFPLIEAAEDYEQAIGFLKSQLNDIQKKYDELIKTYGESFVVGNDGKTLLAYLQELKAYNSSNVLSDLLTEARTHFYVKENSTVDYSLKKKELEKELEKANETLEKLELIYKGSASGSTVVLDTKVLKDQYDLVYDLNYQIEIIDGYIGGTYSETFDKKIQDAVKTVADLTESYSTTSATVYSNASSVVYIQPGIVSVQGGMSLKSVALLSIVAGVVVALVAAYVAGYLALKKKKATAEAASDGAQAEQTEQPAAETEPAETKPAKKKSAKAKSAEKENKE